MATQEVNGADMADTTADAKANRRRRNWRHYENRASSKYVSKRVSEDDHTALAKYAEDHGVEIAELLTPFVNDLIQRAHEYCGQLDEVAPAKAS
jgi:hypothetical protein